MSKLEDREKVVLHTIITQYILNSEPVGSRNVSKVGPLRMSPATIRNIMGDLEEKGYLTQPHTSAGRIPTDLGYKYYIDNLIGVDLGNIVSQDIQEALNFSASNMPAMMQEFSRRLSMLTKAIGFVVVSRTDTQKIKQIEFTRLNKNSALAIMITNSGIVQNVILNIDTNITDSDLVLMSNYLNEKLEDMNISDLSLKIQKDLDKTTGEVHKILATLELFQQDNIANGIFLEGTSHILEFPEFQDAGKLKELLLAFEEKKKLLETLENCMNNKGVQIFVGREVGLGIEELGLVTRSYEKDGHIIGMVGVLGPKRMEYGKMINVVNYSSHMLGKMIEQLYGGYIEDEQK